MYWIEHQRILRKVKNTKLVLSVKLDVCSRTKTK